MTRHYPPCPKCGGPMRTGRDQCARCRFLEKQRAEYKPRPSPYAPCPKCGRRMALFTGRDACSKCRHSESNQRYMEAWSHSRKGPRVEVGRRCNVCNTMILTAPDGYDPRYVRFCEKCRGGRVRDIEMASKLIMGDAR